MRKHVPVPFAALLCALVLLPIGTIFLSFLGSDPEVWAHIKEYLLGRLVLNSLKLVLIVGTIATLLGVSLAWLLARYEFPGRRFFEWALVLPLAFPGYVLAFVYLDLFDYAGPVQTFLRDGLGDGSLVFPPFQSLGGVSFVLSLALFPYIYLLARGAFHTQSQSVLEAARSLGGSSFWVSIAMARPWILGGLFLVIMETLADFGSVSVFNYDTLTTGIYQTWFGLFSSTAAAQLSSFLVLFVLFLLLVERRYRSKMATTSELSRRVQRKWLVGSKRIVATTYAGGVFALGFLLPFVRLLEMGFSEGSFTQDFLGYAGHSLMLALMGSLLVVLAALVLGWSARGNRTSLTASYVRVSTLGYAVPGTVLAVGFLIPLAWLDRKLSGSEVVLIGTLAAMLLAYLVRFLAVGYHSVNGAFQRIDLKLDEAAKSLGASGISLFQKIHLPLLKSGIMAASLLVFVEVLKEMPITLITRPFGWDTLAVRVFEMTSEGEWNRAALPSVAIVLAGLIPVYLLVRHSRGDEVSS